MRTSLLIFVLAAFVSIVLFETASGQATKKPKSSALVGNLIVLIDRVIGNVEDKEKKDELTQERKRLRNILQGWHSGITVNGKKKVKQTYDKIMEKTPQFIDLADDQTKAKIEDILKKIKELSDEVLNAE
ncbi:uncharacterized protein [Periplaneta americana]|uniref:uncharacterized protein n=1 Tax=Periplaneta americana TaxID=6978 RepID=UPI0037E86951